jgi:hypothetical protein
MRPFGAPGDPHHSPHRPKSPRHPFAEPHAQVGGPPCQPFHVSVIEHARAAPDGQATFGDQEAGAALRGGDVVAS